jgi:putative beta-barrel porin BBP2
VVVGFGATAPGRLSAPAVLAPLESLRVERTAGGVQLRIRVAPEVSYEVRREGDRLLLLFVAPVAAASPVPASPVPAPPVPAAPAPASPVPASPVPASPAPASPAPATPVPASPAPASPAPTSSAEVYRGLFPPSVAGSDAGTGSGGPPAEGLDAALPSERPPEERPDGFHVGSMTFKPSASLRYVDADVSPLDTPQTVRDRYGEARPALAFEMPLRDGRLRLDYEARLRRFSSFEQLNGVSHQANAQLEYPMGPSLTVRGLGHFARGVLETAEVDPGGEYFFSLGHFTRRQFGGGARVRTGGPFDVDVAGVLDKVTVDEHAGFFGFERRTFTGGLGMAIGPERRSSLNYSFEQVPFSPERPEAESRVHTIAGAVEGEIMPLLSGRAVAGYAWRESPRAAPGGQRFRGLTFGAQLTRDFGRSAHLTLSANRSTELSAFEHNAFYVATSVLAVFTAPLPLSFSFSAGGGYHVNRYPTIATALGAPRHDEIVHWMAGIGRSISRWAFVRADYRRDQRDSNLDFYDQHTHAFYAELGLGFFPQASRP